METVVIRKAFPAIVAAVAMIAALFIITAPPAEAIVAVSDSAKANGASGWSTFFGKDRVVLTVTASETSGNHDPNDPKYSKVLWRKTGDLINYRDIGTGGTSESSGCKTIKLTNTGKSFLFKSVLFRYITYTHWCWTRSTGNTYSRWTDWTFADLALGVSWLGEVVAVAETFDWNGHPTGGYRHYRRGGFQSISLCFNIGCNTYSYPGNDFYGYANGTWKYNVFGADS